jgi:hypothetical protein
MDLKKESTVENHQNWEENHQVKNIVFNSKILQTHLFPMKKAHLYFLLISLMTRAFNCFWQEMILANVHVNTTKNT